MSSGIDEMLSQFKEHQKELNEAEDVDEDENEEESTVEIPEPTAKPLTNAKPIKPDRGGENGDNDGMSRQNRWKWHSLSDDKEGVTRSESGRAYYYTPAERDRNYAEHRLETDVPAWMHTTANTKLYAAGHSTVFHADRNCGELQRADDDRIRTYPIRFVVTRDVSPKRPCPNCTLDMANTVRVAIEYDHVAPEEVVYPIDNEEVTPDAE